MLYTTLADVNLEKYKRVFVFGCSFTGYCWPTWADIVSWQIPDAEYYNFGRAGAGQTFIVCQLSQAINKYNLGPDDLVMIMWSTFYREDRYLYGKKSQNWSTPGNIFTAQHEVPQDFIDQYVCSRGMYVRDTALIDTTMRMLEHSAFDSLAALSVSMEYQNWSTGFPPDEQGMFTDILELYKPVEKLLARSLMEPEFGYDGNMTNLGWQCTYKYWNSDTNSEFADYHPSVKHYLAYLEKIGFSPNDHVRQRAQREHERMLEVTDKKQLQEHRPCLIL